MHKDIGRKDYNADMSFTDNPYKVHMSSWLGNRHLTLKREFANANGFLAVKHSDVNKLKSDV
jgi:hypothetical protein